MNYRVVFDASNAGFAGWEFLGQGLLFTTIGLLLVIFRHRLPGQWRNHPKAATIFSFLFLGFSLIWTITLSTSLLREYRFINRTLEEKTFQIVEGFVTDFKPMPYAGHALERFCVQGHCFSYSDYVVTGTFHNTSSHGGPIKEGLPVRVSFVENMILRLEIGQ